MLGGSFQQKAPISDAPLVLLDFELFLPNTLVTEYEKAIDIPLID
ncbi:MAG: hypothetical protein ACKO66_07990 [Flavobacteriales bacterium]